MPNGSVPAAAVALAVLAEALLVPDLPVHLLRPQACSRVTPPQVYLQAGGVGADVAQAARRTVVAASRSSRPS